MNAGTQGAWTSWSASGKKFCKWRERELAPRALEPTMRRLVGGEWGGWCCAIDAHSGAVRAIPDKFVSETEIAYGQVPLGFEELQTESFEPIPYLNGSERTSSDVPTGGTSDQLRRRRVQMHPPFGCGGDTLPGTAARHLLPTPRSGSLELRASTVSAAEVLAAPAWALDALVPGRPGIVRLETVLRGHGGALPTSNINAFPSLGERTRVAVFFSPASGKLAAELPHPSTPHLIPQPVVEVWQERCWSEVVALSVMETSWGPLHLDAVDKSRRVGIGCFGAVHGAAASIAPPSTSESDTVRRGDGRAGITEAAPTWRLPIFGGAELSGGPGLLEVSLVPAGEGGERIVLRRQWRAGDDSTTPYTEEPEVVVVY